MVGQGAELTMLEMSVAQNSMASGDSTIISNGKRSTSVEAIQRGKPMKIQDFNKLRGKQRQAAIVQLEEIVGSLPSFADQQKQALILLQEKQDAVTKILDILGDDADHLPMNALGDFHVLAANPVPFADALQEAAKENELRSPEREPAKKLPDNAETKLKTSTSLNRVVSKTSISSTKSISQKPVRAPSKARALATPLNNRAIKKGSK